MNKQAIQSVLAIGGMLFVLWFVLWTMRHATDLESQSDIKVDTVTVTKQPMGIQPYGDSYIELPDGSKMVFQVIQTIKRNTFIVILVDAGTPEFVYITTRIGSPKYFVVTAVNDAGVLTSANLPIEALHLKGD